MNFTIDPTYIYPEKMISLEELLSAWCNEFNSKLLMSFVMICIFSLFILFLGDTKTTNSIKTLLTYAIFICSLFGIIIYVFQGGYQ